MAASFSTLASQPFYDVPRIRNLGHVDELQVLTYGEPGQRTFNITAASQHGSGVVWLEKEQLFNIAESLARALDLLGERVDPAIDDDEDLGGGEEGDEEDWMDDTIEFKAWRIAMQYDDRRKLFQFAAGGPEPDAEPRETMDSPHDNNVVFYFSQEQAESLMTRGLEIVNAGRPLCPHCGVPINSGEEHVCQRRNGHDPEELRQVMDSLEDE